MDSEVCAISSADSAGDLLVFHLKPHVITDHRRSGQVIVEGLPFQHACWLIDCEIDGWTKAWSNISGSTSTGDCVHIHNGPSTDDAVVVVPLLYDLDRGELEVSHYPPIFTPPPGVDFMSIRNLVVSN